MFYFVGELSSKQWGKWLVAKKRVAQMAQGEGSDGKTFRNYRGSGHARGQEVVVGLHVNIHVIMHGWKSGRR